MRIEGRCEIKGFVNNIVFNPRVKLPKFSLKILHRKKGFQKCSLIECRLFRKYIENVRKGKGKSASPS